MSALEWILALCATVHALALMACFGAISLGHLMGAARAVLVIAPRTQRLARLLRQCGRIAIVTGLLWPWLQTGVVLDDPRSLLDPVQVAQVLTQTSFGHTALVREVLVVVAVLAAGLPSGFAPTSDRAGYFFLSAALATLALQGHAAGLSNGLGSIERITLALHLLAAGAWLGALPVLWVLADRQGTADLARTLAGFSRYGIALVALVVTSGLLSAWYRLGDITLIVTTAYGRILIAKIALVACMGVVALVNRNRLTPALRRPDLQVQQGARRALHGSVALEAGIGALVVAVAFVLGATEPPQ
jgi:putative copper resistance protein D